MRKWLDKLVIAQTEIDSNVEVFLGTLTGYAENGTYIILADCFEIYNLFTYDVLKLNKFGLESLNWNTKECFSEEIDVIQLFNLRKVLPCSKILISDLEKLNLK